MEIQDASLLTLKNKINAFANTSFELSSNMSKTSIGVKKVSMTVNKIKKLSDKHEEKFAEAEKIIKQIKDVIDTKKAPRSAIIKLLDFMEDFLKVGINVAAGIDEISEAIAQTNKTINHVNDMSTENKSNFEALKQEMEKIDISGCKKKILLVDDDEIHLETTRFMLQDEFEIITARSGEEALNLFYQGLVPDLIFLDLVMPNMTGWDTFEKIKMISDLQDVPTAFFTATFDIDEIKQAFDAGVSDYVSKPVERHELMKTIENMLKKGAPINE